MISWTLETIGIQAPQQQGVKLCYQGISSITLATDIGQSQVPLDTDHLTRSEESPERGASISLRFWVSTLDAKTCGQSAPKPAGRYRAYICTAPPYLGGAGMNLLDLAPLWFAHEGFRCGNDATTGNENSRLLPGTIILRVEHKLFASGRSLVMSGSEIYGEKLVACISSVWF